MTRIVLALALGLLVAAFAGARDVKSGSFTFDNWDGPALKVYFVEPEDTPESAPVVIVMHGVDRNADDYARNWKPVAREYGFRFYAPAFPQKDFRGAEMYNLGGYGTSGPYAFTSLEPLYAHIREQRGGAGGYYLFGHSAGAQFVHRAVLMEELPNMRRAFAANAGWYTLPDETLDWPYGLAGTPIDAAALSDWLSSPLTILLGDQDTDENERNLRRTPEASAQGPHRYARGAYFMAAGKRSAERLGAPFGWLAFSVPGISHDNAGMARAAAPLIVEHARTEAILAGLDCGEGPLQLRFDFAGGGQHECSRTPEGFLLTVEPEATPINPSPWYAFDIIADTARMVEVELRYEHSRHRYIPKISEETGIWRPMPPGDITLFDDATRATLSVQVPSGVLRIAGQPVVDAEARASWLERFAERSDFAIRDSGQSVEGTALARLTSLASETQRPENPAPVILILGSQHPPEYTGWIALMAFLERLAADEEAAIQFRSSARIEVFALLNPDGIDAGHWRLNANRTDLNRDWGPFAQPETQAVRDVMEALSAEGHEPVLMFDFHSTSRDLLYTPADDLDLKRAGFVADWIADIEARMSGAGFAVDPGHNVNTPTAKTWFAERFRAPGITVEIGDETSIDRATALGSAAAEALISLWPQYAVAE